MKQKDVLKSISATQDNNALMNEFADNDFLSRFLVNALSDATIPNGHNNVNLNALSTDLAYAIDQLKKAKSVVDVILARETQEREAQEKDFEVEVVRVGYGFKTIKVRAISQEEANKIALDEAGDHEFSEKSSDYKIAE